MHKITTTILLALFFLSCSTTTEETDQVTEDEPSFQNKGHELIYRMVEVTGSYEDLWNKKDVVYTYTYTTPSGETDVSTEKYMFEGELSYGLYYQHERTLPDLEGPIEQGYDGSEFWLKHGEEVLQDSLFLKKVAFNRPTNFYWFVMFQKLLDPGLRYEYLGEQTISNQAYEVVKITFETNDSKPTDTYQLYLNKETMLVDQFLFTVVDYGLTDPFLMELEYEEVENLQIPTKRRYKKSDWEATVTDQPWITVTWTDIQFNNNLRKEDFRK